MPISFKNVHDVGFPGSPVVKTLPSNVYEKAESFKNMVFFFSVVEHAKNLH